MNISITSPVEAELPEELIERIRTQIKEKGEKSPPSMYWDYREEVDLDDVVKYVDEAEKGKWEQPPINMLSNSIWEHNHDNTYRLEVEFIKEQLEDFEDDIRAALGLEEDDKIDLEDVASELRDEFMGDFYVDEDLKSLLRNTPDIPVRVEMTSNYDCINSDWLESQGAYEMESYFGDMVRALHLNPAAVKAMLEEKGRETDGDWPDMPESNPLVSLEELWNEMLNSSCGAQLLTIVTTIDAYDFLSNYIGDDTTFLIPKGTPCGLFSSFQGGGSMLDMKFLRDFEITLSDTWDNGYGGWRVQVDGKGNGYSVGEVFGQRSGIFGEGTVILTEEGNDQPTNQSV